MIFHAAGACSAKRKLGFAASLLALSVILPTSCMAPSRTANAPAARAEPEIPYESMAASIAIGDPEKALAEYDASLKEQAQSRQTRFLHARLLLIAGKYEEAKADLEILLAEDGKDTDVLYSLSIVSGMQNQIPAQKEYLRRVIEVNPAHADALAALGDLALSENDAAKASEYFKKALESDPANFIALRGQGAIYTQNKEYQKAVDVLSKAIEVQPDYAFSFIDRARAESALGDSRNAIADYSKAIEMDPGYSWSYIDRGRVYIRTGKLDQAYEDFSVAIKLDPEIFLPYAMRAEILYQQGKYDQAHSDYQTLLSLKPDYYFAYEPFGVLLYMKNDWAGARREFLDAYKYSPEDHSLALLAAITQRREGKPKQAADYLQGVLKSIPRESLYYDVARFLMDPASGEFALTVRLNEEKNKVLRARMLFFLAEQNIIDGKSRAARDLLFEIENSGAPSSPEILLARWELDALVGRE